NNTATVAPQAFSNDGGTIDVRAGNLQISRTSGTGGQDVSTGGTFLVAAGSILDLTAPMNTLKYAGLYTGSGEGIVRVQGGTVQVGEAGATFNFPTGLFQFASGMIAGGDAGLTNIGSITLVGADHKFVSGQFKNNGTVTHTGDGNLQ